MSTERIPLVAKGEVLMANSKFKDKTMTESKRKPGRPVSKRIPPRNSDTPENVALGELSPPPLQENNPAPDVGQARDS